jgi:TRAP-type C4-dicarboxylate transport system permease small subunit
MLNLFFGITCNYGTDAFKPILILFFLFLLFAGSYRITTSVKRKDSTNPEEKISSWDCLYFSAMVLVNSSTDYIPIGKWRWAVFIERLVGWVLLAIFIITLVRLGLR